MEELKTYAIKIKKETMEEIKKLYNHNLKIMDLNNYNLDNVYIIITVYPVKKFSDKYNFLVETSLRIDINNIEMYGSFYETEDEVQQEIEQSVEFYNSPECKENIFSEIFGEDLEKLAMEIGIKNREYKKQLKLVQKFNQILYNINFNNQE